MFFYSLFRFIKIDKCQGMNLNGSCYICSGCGGCFTTCVIRSQIITNIVVKSNKVCNVLFIVTSSI